MDVKEDTMLLIFRFIGGAGLIVILSAFLAWATKTKFIHALEYVSIVGLAIMILLVFMILLISPETIINRFLA